MRASMVGFVGTVAVGALLAGCGSSGGSAKTSSASTTTTPPVSLTGKVNVHSTKDVSGKGSSARVEMETDDFYFNPTYVKAAPGQTVTLALKNEGKVQHTFTVDALGIDRALAPDASVEVAVTMPASGTLQYHCRFHAAMGMQGAFYSADGAAGGGGTSSTTSSSGGSRGY